MMRLFTKDWFQYLVATVVILGITGVMLMLSSNQPNTSNIISAYQHEDYALPFKINNPTNTYFAPKDFKEISGLTHSTDDLFYIVDDDHGDLFYYDLKSEKIIKEVDFGKNDDYEGVTLNDEYIFIVKSNGDIFFIDKNTGKVDKVETYLSKRNNIEGICYDTSSNSLLLACKGKPENKGFSPGTRCVYQFDLSSRKLKEQPFLQIVVKDEMKNLKALNLNYNFVTKINYNTRITRYSPSGIDIDPITGDIYIVSNRGKLLTVFDKEKNLKGVYFLSEKIFGQPEGLTFDENGNLYISNEARSTKANILQFERLDKIVKPKL